MEQDMQHQREIACAQQTYLLIIMVGGHALLFTCDVLTFQKVYLAFQ